LCLREDLRGLQADPGNSQVVGSSDLLGGAALYLIISPYMTLLLLSALLISLFKPETRVLFEVSYGSPELLNR
jgi:hypothetical protein